ncbi:DUF2968 domain-containing protein [Burkholderia pyrrocinia]|uniref:DUF2968 domain-containing protein n=1 Tax=Burkholderia pyrrocinia TaxID=60550 RepID=UPI00158A9F1F|nr:DUF2968 domain-containing protein [Burkholderia pyrrocinia]
MFNKWKLRRMALIALCSTGVAQTSQAQPLPDSAAAAVDNVRGTFAGPSVAPNPRVATSSGGAQLVSPALPPEPSASLTADEAQQSAAGNVAELQRMMAGTDLQELRTTYNGSYGASLLYYGKETTYYVALFQQKHFWRVVKTQDDMRAGMIYKDFAGQTERLAAIEIRRATLDAEKAQTERMVALAQERANALQADLDNARRQQAIVASQQEQARAQAAALQAENVAARQQLRAAQQRVRDLDRQLETGMSDSCSTPGRAGSSRRGDCLKGRH